MQNPEGASFMVNQQHENHELYLHLPPTVSSASVQVTVYNMCPTQGPHRPASKVSQVQF